MFYTHTHKRTETQMKEEREKKTCSIAVIQLNEIYIFCIWFVRKCQKLCTNIVYIHMHTADIITEYPIYFNIVWTKHKTNNAKNTFRRQTIYAQAFGQSDKNMWCNVKCRRCCWGLFKQNPHWPNITATVSLCFMSVCVRAQEKWAIYQKQKHQCASAYNSRSETSLIVSFPTLRELTSKWKIDWLISYKSVNGTIVRAIFFWRSCDRLIHSVQPFVCVMLHTTCIEIAPVELNGTKSQIKPNENPLYYVNWREAIRILRHKHLNT